MAIANNVIFLALRNAGVNGVGQTPLADDVNDAFTILNAQIGQWSLERKVMVNATALPQFPDLTTDEPFWDPYLHVLLTSLAVRLRQVYALPPLELDVQMAMAAIKAFQAINQQQIEPIYALTTPTTAEPIIYLALRTAGRLNDTQSVASTSKDVADGLGLLNALIAEWNLERERTVNPVTLPLFPTLTTAVSFWDPYQQALLTNLSVRIQQATGVQPSPVDLQIAVDNRKLLQAINQQQIAPIHPGVPSTCLQVIFLALRMAGRITDAQSVSDSSKDVDDGMSALVSLIAQWQKKRWLTYVEQELSVPSSTGAQYYTIGPGMDFNTPSRPDSITSAYIRIMPGVPPNLVDIPLEILNSREDYSQISVKTLQTMPAYLFYETGWPTGKVWIWPVAPANQYGIYVTVKAPLPTYTAVTDAFNLPPEYLEAVTTSLACRICAMNGQVPSAYLMAQAEMAINTLRQANTQIPLLRLPGALGLHRYDASLVGPGLGRAFILNQDVVLG